MNVDVDGSRSIMSSVRLHKVRLFVQDCRPSALLFFTEKTGMQPLLGCNIKLYEEVQRSQFHLLYLRLKSP